MHLQESPRFLQALRQPWESQGGERVTRAQAGASRLAQRPGWDRGRGHPASTPHPKEGQGDSGLYSRQDPKGTLSPVTWLGSREQATPLDQLSAGGTKSHTT